MATLNLKGTTTVKELKEQFHNSFGSQLRMYDGNKVADDGNNLSAIGLKADGKFECRSSLTVASFIARMLSEFGLKVKVYTCDNWVAVLDGLTLESSGKVKKSAVRADMESMIAYQQHSGGKAESSANIDMAMEALSMRGNDKPKDSQIQSEQSITKNDNGALLGLFSVGEDKQVRFSIGNLQYNPAKSQFRFAEHQWDMIGKENEKMTPTYDGWIDMFQYGTSGYKGCQPGTFLDFGADDNLFPKKDICKTDYDWGQYNAIINGGNKAGLWRTLTEDEFMYLVDDRPQAEDLRRCTNVLDVTGVILMPDRFYDRDTQFSFDPKSCKGFDAERWKTMEKNGAVFFPYCYTNCIGGNKVFGGNQLYMYWCATGWVSSDGIAYCYDEDELVAFGGVMSMEDSFNAVRLAQDVKK